MKIVKLISLLLAVLLVCAPTGANAWFFFFLPGSVTSKISDAITGSEGEHCVKATATVGDILTSPSGNTATIKSLSGTSSRCRNPDLPIRALIELNYSFSSKSGIDIPDGFEQKPLTDMQRFNGSLLKAENPLNSIGFVVMAGGRNMYTIPEDAAQLLSSRMIASLEQANTLNEEELTVNGIRALRFEIVGKTRTVFHPQITYLITLLNAREEYLVVTAWTPTRKYEENREAMRQLIYRVSGLTPSESTPAPELSERAAETPAAPEGK